MEARRILIEHNLRLVAHIAKKYADESSMDDYISVGTIGLIKGIDTYDKEKCSKLSSYISRCIENEVLMVIRNNKKTMCENRRGSRSKDILLFLREGECSKQCRYRSPVPKK